MLESYLRGTTAIRTIISQRVQWLGSARWKVDISTAMNEALALEAPSRQREIELLCFKLGTSERLEAISLLELALWKVKSDEQKTAKNTEEQIDEERILKKRRLVKSDLKIYQEEVVDRQSCGINSGADVVISNVLPFLDKLCGEDYYNVGYY
jgi:hypothetical protein